MKIYKNMKYYTESEFIEMTNISIEKGKKQLQKDLNAKIVASREYA